MAKHKSKHRYDEKQAGVQKASAFWSFAPNLVRSSQFGFTIAFTLLCIGLYAAINVLPSSFTTPINEHVAATMGLVLNAFGFPVANVRDTISYGGLTFKIIPECTPLFMAGIFLSFVIFYPATVWQKALGLALGIPALYLGNLIRLALTFMVSRYDRSLFEVCHVYLGQVFTIFMVITACILWLKWIDKKEPQQSIPLKAAFFLARFAVIAGCLFLVWIKVHHGYIWFVDRFMIFGFSLFGRRLIFPQYAAVYYETFSIVTFTSLVLAAQSMPLVIKIRVLATGLGFLFLTHLFHRIDDTLITSFRFTNVITVDQTLIIIGQYLLPVLFLIYLIRCQKGLEGEELNRID